jgi:hypothetical protein
MKGVWRPAATEPPLIQRSSRSITSAEPMQGARPCEVNSSQRVRTEKSPGRRNRRPALGGFARSPSSSIIPKPAVYSESRRKQPVIANEATVAKSA